MNLKILILFLTAISLFSCVQDLKNEVRKSNEIAQDLHWLLGSWVRTNGANNKQTYEIWEKTSSDEFVGLGYTLENSDTVFKENIRIFNINNNWVFEVTGVNEDKTVFNFIEKTDSSFICENKINEFPKRIKYSIKRNTLTAIIYDDEKEIPFIFRKLH